MKSNIIFTGDIRKVTNYKLSKSKFIGNNVIRRYNMETETYKENAILIKVSEFGDYIDIDNITSIFELLKIKNCLLKGGRDSIEDKILSIQPPQQTGNLFIESTSLIPYFNAEKNESVCNLKKIRRNHNI